jgi:hypothetical protein
MYEPETTSTQRPESGNINIIKKSIENISDASKKLGVQKQRQIKYVQVWSSECRTIP